MGAVAGVLEPHSDDVSQVTRSEHLTNVTLYVCAQVRFHPTQRQMLVSAGMDGLLCVHDTSLGLDEDNATIAGECFMAACSALIMTACSAKC